MAAAAELTDDIKVLVADDQGVIRMGLAMILDHEPDLTTIAQAENGEEALRLIEEHDPDVVLMDIRLPDMDGAEAMRRLKDDERTAAIPVVALTSLAMKGDREWLLSVGFDGYLEKPIDVRAFPAQVRDYVLPGADV
jgi:CheY-like chemotaxis protein